MQSHADVAQLVERIPRKDEVAGSTPAVGSAVKDPLRYSTVTAGLYTFSPYLSVAVRIATAKKYLQRSRKWRSA